MNIYVQNQNSTYQNTVNEIIQNRKKEIFNFFNSKEKELPFNIFIYDSIESLIKGMKERGFSDMPDYMCACHKDEDNSLNFFEPNDENKDEYSNVIFHELIHGIQFIIFGTTPEWINEGIAKYLDGTYSKGIEWLLDNYINNNDIPNQIEIENEFGMHKYDSYDYAYLMVSYIIDSRGKDYLIELLKDNKKLEYEKVDLLNRSINYYNNKYKKGNDNYGQMG